MALTNLSMVVKNVDGDRPASAIAPGSILLVPEFPAVLHWRVQIVHDKVGEKLNVDFEATVENPRGSVVARSSAGSIRYGESDTGTNVSLSDFEVSEPGEYTVRASIAGETLPPQRFSIKPYEDRTRHDSTS